MRSSQRLLVKTLSCAAASMIGAVAFAGAIPANDDIVGRLVGGTCTNSNTGSQVDCSQEVPTCTGQFRQVPHGVNLYYIRYLLSPCAKPIGAPPCPKDEYMSTTVCA